MSYTQFAEEAVATNATTLNVQMFVHKDPKEAEKAVALWLQQHPVRVQHVTQSQSEKGGHFIFVLTLFYQHS